MGKDKVADDTLIGFDAYLQARQKAAPSPHKKEENGRKVTFTVIFFCRPCAPSVFMTLLV